MKIYLGIPVESLIFEDYIGLDTVKVYDRYTGKDAGTENLAKRVMVLRGGKKWSTPEGERLPYTGDSRPESLKAPYPTDIAKYFRVINGEHIFALKEETVTRPPTKTAFKYLEDMKVYLRDILKTYFDYEPKAEEYNLYFD